MVILYDFIVKDIAGVDVKLEEFKGKVLLIVNTASQCGFTPQYAELEELYKKYKDFVVLGFPCNQFLSQEPGNEEEIKKFVETQYGITFPMFSKITVNGSETNPLFDFLKTSVPGFLVNSVKWNFTKFLVNRQGIPIKRYSPQTKPSSIIEDIEKEIAKDL